MVLCNQNVNAVYNYNLLIEPRSKSVCCSNFCKDNLNKKIISALQFVVRYIFLS